MEWQPIETAPKDGVYLFAGGNLDCIEIGRIRGNEVRFYDGDKYDPTHWMPLPPPPKE